MTDEWIKKMCYKHTHIQTQWNNTQPLNKRNSAICNNVDGPSRYYGFSEISQIEKDKHFVITYLCNLKNKQMYIAKRNRLKDIVNKTVVTNGKREGSRVKWRGRLRDTNHCV